jgi:predicted GIY-YIG superfamily endonuclease
MALQMSDNLQSYYVYILENPKSHFYIGHTDNLERRPKEHNSPQPGLGKYTHKNGPWHLVWFEAHPSRSSAMTRERQIKCMKSSFWIRQNLLNGRVPM